MPTAILSPTAKQQFFTSGSTVAAGYRLYTYFANTQTPAETYVNRAGTTPNQNPIILNARGEATIYLQPGVVYDYVLKTDQDATVWTQEDVSANAGDADAVAFLQSGTGAVTRTTQDKLRERITPDDFGAAANGIADDVAAIAAANAEGPFRFVAGRTYRVGSDITINSDVEFEPGARITVDSGKSVTFLGAINAGFYQIFDGAGQVSGFEKNWSLLPEWWGAVPDGVTDSTSAVQAALDNAEGREVPLSGLYRISAALQIAAPVLLIGKSKTNSGFQTSNLTANILEVQCGAGPLTGVEIRDVFVDATAAKTAGYGIAVLCTSGGTLFDGVIDNVSMSDKMFSGLRVQSAFFLRLNDINIVKIGQNGVGFDFRGIDATSKVANVYMNKCIVRFGTAGTVTIGMLIDSYCEGFYVDAGSFESAGLNYGVYISNSLAAPRPPENLWFSKVVCDNNATTGWLLEAALQVRMTDCWSVTCVGDGIRIGACTDVELKGHASISNGAYGLFLQATAKQIRIIGGTFDVNGQSAPGTLAGIVVAANTTDFSITNASFYRDGSTKSQAYDIQILAGTSDRYLIKNNSLRGYLTAPVQDGGTGVNKFISENIT